MSKHAEYMLDSSFVLRLLTGTPPSQFRFAMQFYRDSISGENTCWIPDLVLAECYFALQHHYGYTKRDALDSLRELSKQPNICMEAHAHEILQREDLATAKPGFIDRLIHGHALHRDCHLVTFEKAAKRLGHTLVI